MERKTGKVEPKMMLESPKDPQKIGEEQMRRESSGCCFDMGEMFERKRDFTRHKTTLVTLSG